MELVEKCLCENETGYLPCGIIRDYPLYEVRGFGIDVGRRAISMDLLYEIVKELSAHKMNTLQVHLNDNQIITQSGYDGTMEGAMNLYRAVSHTMSYALVLFAFGLLATIIYLLTY